MNESLQETKNYGDKGVEAGEAGGWAGNKIKYNTNDYRYPINAPGSHLLYSCGCIDCATP